MSIDDLELPGRLQQRLNRVLPGRSVRERFAPGLSYGRHFGPALSTSRRAAVMILLLRRESEWRIPFTLRPPNMKHHGGQISLPGGGSEASEGPELTAQRELAEELGVTPEQVRPLGRLSPSYLYISDFVVTPCVAVCHQETELRPCPQEVAEVIEIPLRGLLNRENHTNVWIHDARVADETTTTLVGRRGVWMRSPAIQWQNYSIWGATALILGELLEILADVQN